VSVSATQVRRIVNTLAGTSEAPHFDRIAFRVDIGGDIGGGKTRNIATMPPDGGDLNVFLDDQSREQALVLHADCVTKLWWGKRVWGVTVDLKLASVATVKRLLSEVHAQKRQGSRSNRKVAD
jgi:hypothetical protein